MQHGGTFARVCRDSHALRPPQTFLKLSRAYPAFVTSTRHEKKMLNGFVHARDAWSFCSAPSGSTYMAFTITANSILQTITSFRMTTSTSPRKPRQGSVRRRHCRTCKPLLLPTCNQTASNAEVVLVCDTEYVQIDSPHSLSVRMLVLHTRYYNKKK